MMIKIKQFFGHVEIQLAISAGMSIIVQAYFYKNVLHIERSGLLYLLPGFIILFYETLVMSNRAKEKKNQKVKEEGGQKVEKIMNPIFLKPIYWHLFIILSTILSIGIPYFRQ